jgi:catechol 2,3-dioxygenase-like lactoylglutathione lyase family enzyme
MSAKLNHIAIVSDTFAMVSQFYQAVFGFNPPAKQKNFNAATVGDGYVGININPRRPSRPAGLDHFGVEVEDAAEVLDRLKRKYPAIGALQRPSNRPFAGITTHDPDGNLFDLSQANMANRGEIYTDMQSADRDGPRRISHFALRTMQPERLAEFYADVLGLAPANRSAGDPNHYLTDGRVTLVLMGWDIKAFEGTGIVRPGPNHIGVTVESIAGLKADIERVAGGSPQLAPKRVDMGPEGEKSRQMLAHSAPYAAFQMSDNDNVLIAVAEQG